MDAVLNARRRRLYLFAAALAALAVLAALDFHAWSTAQRWNRVIAALEVSGTAVESGTLEHAAPAEARFALALAIERRGEVAPAVALLREVAQTRPDLAPAALYDAANALLREGQRIGLAEDAGQALPFVELAKETYREVLRIDPDVWDARFNLERALRIAPEGDADSDEELPMPADAEEAATTDRASPLGLP
jgi:mxaK protein